MKTRGFAAVLAVVAGALGALIPATSAEAAVNVKVDAQISAHNLPYLDSPYVPSSTLAAGTTVSVECQAQGRETVGDSAVWYRVNHVYYPSYAFAGSPDKVPCGSAAVVPSAANGYTAGSFDSTPRAGWFSTGDNIKILCTAAGQTVDGSNAWFFARGYWLHSSRISGHPNGNGFATCWGYDRPGQAPTNDYPYSGQTSGVDPWGFYKGQCTSFAAFRLNDRTGIDFSNSYRGVHWGNASNWDNAARSAGITVNSTPEVGAVAQTDAGSGHVAWVTAVNGNTITVEEYNYLHPEHYGTRSAAKSDFVYLHF